eukprot:scaffold48209_cov34-Prasinocladus_malaysianus.AAC.1
MVLRPKCTCHRKCNTSSKVLRHIVAKSKCRDQDLRCKQKTCSGWACYGIHAQLGPWQYGVIGPWQLMKAWPPADRAWLKAIKLVFLLARRNRGNARSARLS